MARMRELLRAASDTLEKGSDPFDNSWLVEHEVTADECFDLALAMSAAIDVFLTMRPPEKKEGKR